METMLSSLSVGNQASHRIILMITLFVRRISQSTLSDPRAPNCPGLEATLNFQSSSFFPYGI